LYVNPAALTLEPEEMRRLGYLVVDTLIEHFTTLPGKPVTRRGTRPALEAEFREPPPETATDPEALVRRLVETTFSSHMHVDHPRFFGFVPSPGNFVGAMADALASGFNTFVGTWFAGSGAAEIELVTVDWLRELCGLPEAGGGLFVSGGSIANLTAIALARHVRLSYAQDRGVLYYSDQTHSAVDRAIKVLGFSPAQIRRIPSDEQFRLPLYSLEGEVARDRSQGRIPFCVIANAGTTNTGAVDPLPELAAFCAHEGLWLHVDGAYGAAAVITDEGRRALTGLELADSIALDPHKWLFQPFEIGCVLARDRMQLKNAFRVMPEYLRDVHRDQEEVNFCDYGIQLSRGFRALKLWLSMKTFGLAAFRQAIEHGLEMARFAEQRLRSGPWEIVTPAQLGIVSFRHADDAITHRLVGDMIAGGFALLTSTVLNGRPALRFCTINPRTTEADVLQTIDCLEALAAVA
jgi:glutamate/tyrosine decarboxylase-like PLP-dependent enzyme